MYPLKLLMIVTFAEAVSWMGLLLGMVLKYGFGNPAGVSIMGPIHGFLFLTFCATLVVTQKQETWPLRRSILAFLETIPPFLGFLLGTRLLEEVRSRDTAVSPTA